MTEEMKPVTISLKVGTKIRRVEVASDVLSHVFTAHSLNLTNWQKSEKEKFIAEISEHNSRDETVRKANWFHDATEDIKRRREQVNNMEAAFKDLMESPE